MKKIGSYLFEAGKWLLIVWLLYPISYAHRQPVDAVRFVGGVTLFVIVIGKTFYDVLYERYLHRKKRSIVVDLLSTAGIILLVSILLGIVIYFIGMMIGEQITKPLNPPAET